eukprot:scaffold9676_cov113-Isochrysis_galbana.AAC.4
MPKPSRGIRSIQIIQITELRPADGVQKSRGKEQGSERRLRAGTHRRGGARDETRGVRKNPT